MNRKSLSYISVFAMALILWALLYFSISHRYDHFSDFGTVENYPLLSSPLEKQTSQAVNQLGHTGFFWSEAAFHYRTTLMYAVDWYQDPSILSKDRWQQYPDGIDAWSQYSLLMEPVLGTLYRWFAADSQSLIQFLMVVLPLLHVLLFFPVFLLAQTLSGDRRFALVSVAVFATTSLAFSPLLGSFYVKETFSWLLFALFLVGHFSYLLEAKTSWLVLGALGLFFFLISWHLAQFLTVPVMLVGLLSQMGQRKKSFRFVLAQPLLYGLVFLLAGFVPWLWQRTFLLSTPALVVWSWLALATFSQFRPSYRFSPKLSLVLVGVLAAGILVLTSRSSGDYAHVGGLLWSRVINGFQKPMDPLELPFAVRVFWVAPFSSPRLLAIQAGLGVNGILLFGATIWSFIRSFQGEKSTFEKSFIWCTALFFLAFVLVERLAPVWILFAAIALARCGLQLRENVKGKTLRKIILPVLIMLPLVNLFYSMGAMVQISLAALNGESRSVSRLDKQWESARAQMFQWIRNSTPEMASFVGEIGVSPQLLLYTGRPIVLNSQFENQKIRTRYAEYLNALYSRNEDDLFNFFKKHQIDYVFINRDWAIAQGRNTPGYLAGKTGQVSLKRNISRLHFYADGLNYFEPVYENDFYRVFSFVEDGVTDGECNRDKSFSKWWNVTNFHSSQNVLPNSAEDYRALQKLDSMFRKLPEKIGQVATGVERGRKADNPRSVPRENLLSLQERLALARFDLLVKGESNSLLQKTKDLELTISKRLAEINPVSEKTVSDELLGFLNGSSAIGQGLLKAILPYECSPDEYALTARIMVLLGEFAAAGEFFGRGGSVYPKPVLTQNETGLRPTEVQEQLWKNTVLYLIAGADVNKGKNLARFCATHVAPGSSRQAFFIAAGSIKTFD